VREGGSVVSGEVEGVGYGFHICGIWVVGEDE
jgi:hypothetical protein